MARTDKQIDAALRKLPTGRDQASVAELRDNGYKHAEVADRLGIGVVKAQVLHYRNTTDPVEPTAKNVVRLRDKEQMSWGRIAVATGYSEAKAKAVYAEATGKHHRDADLGRGGRPPKAAKKAAKKATKKKAATKAKKKQPAKKKAAKTKAA